MDSARSEVFAEFYSRYIARDKDLFKRSVTPDTRHVLDLMEKDSYFLGSSEPYVASLLSFVTLMSEPRSVLEIGTLIGYSTIIIADCLAQNKTSSSKIFTVDPDTRMVEIAKKYVSQAGLEDHAEFLIGKSLDPEIIELLHKYGPFDLLFVDSLHNYSNTIKEMRSLTYFVRDGGLIICHDSGIRAQNFDTEKRGGVRRALLEFTSDKKEFLFLDPPIWAPIGSFIMKKQPARRKFWETWRKISTHTI